MLGFLFFRKFQMDRSKTNLILCGILLGFALMVRKDAILFIIPLFIFLLYEIIKRRTKVQHIIFYSIPVIFFNYVNKGIDFLRFESPPVSATSDLSVATSLITSVVLGFAKIPIGIFGLFLSPGVGLFIFPPIHAKCQRH